MVPFEKIFKALNKAKVRYLVAGGVATNFHGVIRTTVDLDLIIHLEKENVLNFVNVVKQIGFVPKVPVRPEDLAEAENREKWIHEKAMIVFSFINPNNPMEIIDIFVKEPSPFEQLYKRRYDAKAFGDSIPVLGIDDLIKLKKDAGRKKDILDLDLLEARKRRQET